MVLISHKLICFLLFLNCVTLGWFTVGCYVKQDTQQSLAGVPIQGSRVAMLAGGQLLSAAVAAYGWGNPKKLRNEDK